MAHQISAPRRILIGTLLATTATLIATLPVTGASAYAPTPTTAGISAPTFSRPEARPLQRPNLTTTAPRTQTSSLPCGGSTVANPAGGTWRCTFDDEFAGSTVNRANWLVQTTAASGFTAGPVCFVNNPNNVSVSNGTLKLTARKLAAPTLCASPNGAFSTQYTSGSLNTYGLFAQAYGRFEVRAKFPATTVKGLQESLWLWPVDALKYGYPWPKSGEIDIAEEYSLYADRVIPFVHYVPAALDTNVTNNYCLINNVGAFHTYSVDWTPQTITIRYDGKTCVSDNWNPQGLTKPAPFDQPFLVALTQGLGVGGNAFTSSTPLPATTEIDYVRVWG